MGTGRPEPVCGQPVTRRRRLAGDRADPLADRQEKRRGEIVDAVVAPGVLPNRLHDLLLPFGLENFRAVGYDVTARKLFHADLQDQDQAQALSGRRQAQLGKPVDEPLHPNDTYQPAHVVGAGNRVEPVNVGT